MEQIHPGSASIPAGNLCGSMQSARSVGGLHIAEEIGGGVFNSVATPHSYAYDGNNSSATHVPDVSGHAEAMHGSNALRNDMQSVTTTTFAQNHSEHCYTK